MWYGTLYRLTGIIRRIMAEEKKQSIFSTVFWLLVFVGIIVWGVKACTWQDTTATSQKEEDNAPFTVTTDTDYALSAKYVNVSDDGITFDITYDGDTGSSGAGKFYQIAIKHILVNGKDYTPSNLEDGTLSLTVDGQKNDLGIVQFETKGKYTTGEEVEDSVKENVTKRITISSNNCQIADDYKKLTLKFDGTDWWYNDNGSTTPFDFGVTQTITINRNDI